MIERINLWGMEIESDVSRFRGDRDNRPYFESNVKSLDIVDWDSFACNVLERYSVGHGGERVLRGYWSLRGRLPETIQRRIERDLCEDIADAVWDAVA